MSFFGGYPLPPTVSVLAIVLKKDNSPYLKRLFSTNQSNYKKFIHQVKRYHPINLNPLV